MIMKTIQRFIRTGICAAALILLMGMNCIAQKKIEVTNIQAKMSKGMQPCYFVEIPHAKLKTVQQNWIKKLQEGSKIKAKEINQEIVLAKALKPEFSTDTVNIYSILIQKDSAISMDVFIEFDNTYFKPSGDKTDLASEKKDNSIKNFIRSFAVDQYKLAVTGELEGEQEKLETLQNDLKKLVKEQENMEKDNSSLDNDIDKSEREIKEIEANIDLKNKAILDNNTSMLTITGDADKKAAQDKQKGLEKDKNKLEKDRSRAKDEISSDKSKIDKNKNEIEDNKKEQEDMTEQITKQTEVVTKVQTKLDGIK
jgi:hypothetical protein